MDVKGKRKAAVQPIRERPLLPSETGESDSDNDPSYSTLPKPAFKPPRGGDWSDCDSDPMQKEADPGFLVRAMETNPLLKGFYETLVRYRWRSQARQVFQEQCC